MPGVEVKSLAAQLVEREAQPECDYRTCPVRKGKPRVALEVCKYCRWKTYAICKRDEANDSR